MTRTCIPQSNSVSPVLIKASHWEKYIGDIVSNYIKTGFGLSAGTGLTVNIASGNGYIGGIEIESDATDSNQCTLTASTTNYIYAQLTRDGSNEPSGWGYTSNTTGITPTDSILLGTAVTNGSGVTSVSTSTTQQGLAIKAFTAAGNIALGTNKVTFTAGSGTGTLFADSTSGNTLMVRSGNGTNTKSQLEIVPIGAGSNSVRSAIEIYGTDKTTGSGNDERLQLIASDSSGTPNGYLINVSRSGTGSLRTLKIQMNATDILTFNTDNSVDANSRPWSNFVLGNNLNAGSNRLTKAASLHFDATNVDTDSNIMGSRSNDLSILSCADGTNARAISLRTPSTTTAGTGTPLTRFNITGGAAQATATFSSTDVSIGVNQLQTTGYAFLESANIIRIRRFTTDQSADIYIHGNGAATRNGVTIFEGSSASGANILIDANTTAHFINVQAGTSSLRNFIIKMGGNNIFTFNTDNSVNFNSRAVSNFKLGSQMDANSNNIVNVNSLVLGANSTDAVNGDIIGFRTALLGIVAAADGTTARQIMFYTQSAVTAGSANRALRLQIDAGVSQGSSLITSYEPFDFESYQDLKVISAPSNPASGYVRLYPKSTDANNDDLYLKHKLAGTVTEEKVAVGLQGVGQLMFKQKNTTTYMQINSTGFLPVSGWDVSTTNIPTSEQDVQMICPVAGTIKNLSVKVDSFTMTTATITVTVRKNSADTTLTTTITSASSVFSDTTHSFTVAAGDTIAVKFVAPNSGTGSAGGFYIALQYVK